RSPRPPPSGRFSCRDPLAADPTSPAHHRPPAMPGTETRDRMDASRQETPGSAAHRHGGDCLNDEKRRELDLLLGTIDSHRELALIDDQPDKLRVDYLWGWKREQEVFPVDRLGDSFVADRVLHLLRGLIPVSTAP